MVALKIKSFGGQIPAIDDHILPDSNAAYAQNTWLAAGRLEGMYAPQLVHTCTTPLTRKVFRIPLSNLSREYITSSFWMEFQDADTDVVKSPIASDSFERYYWCSPSMSPHYNTKARLIAGSANYVLGIPQPSAPPGIAVTGGSATNVTRAYLYTWVSTYGEEGPPSGPTTTTNHPDGTWTITLTAPTGTDTANRSLDHVNIYRTITSSAGVATFFFVASVPIATTTYADSNSDTLVSANNQLKSTGYTAPPTDLSGMTAMPNGVIAGFRGNEVWFTEPYLPHAWPAAYTINVDFPIVALASLGQSLIIMTAVSPYVATGVNPASMALSRASGILPCLSRGSVISSDDGVLFASAEGMAAISPAGAVIASRKVIDKVEWVDSVYLRTLRCAGLNGAVYGWGSSDNGCFEPTAFDPARFEQSDQTGSRDGFMMNMDDPRIAWTTLVRTDPVDSVMNDVWTGETFIISANKVLWVNTSEASGHEVYLWRSKQFQPTSPKNMGRLKVMFALPVGVTMPTQQVKNTLNQTLQANQLGLVRVYADGILRNTFELRVSGDILPEVSGFYADYWQVEIEARVKIFSVEIGTTAKELGGV